MFKAKKWMVLGLFGLVAAAGATVLTVPTWSTSAPGQSSDGQAAVSVQDWPNRPLRSGIVPAATSSFTAKPRWPRTTAGSRVCPRRRRWRRPTRAQPGADRIDVKSAQARAYVTHLQKRQKLHENTIAGTLGHRLNVHHRMQHAVNAEIVDLTASEAARVGKLPDVALVEASRVYQSIPIRARPISAPRRSGTAPTPAAAWPPRARASSPASSTRASTSAARRSPPWIPSTVTST